MKNKQGITIAALIIAIVGLSIGFAAFANTLTISSSASVNPDPTSMNVVFSSSSTSAQINPITPTKNLDNVTNFTATNATITGADYRTLNNVSAAFTEPGQTVTYNLYVYNAGSYKAYLNELNMGTKTCSIVENQEHPEQEATESLKNAACNGISISVSIDNVTLTSSGSLNNMELNVDSSKPVQIVISYASGSAYVDGPISVSFGNITFNATSAPISSGGQGGNEQGGGQSGQEQQSTPVAGTYTGFVGDISEIVLNNDGTASIQVPGEGTFPITYTYDSTNSIVTLIGLEEDTPMNYTQVENNKVLSTDMFGSLTVLTTNGSNGLTLSATYTCQNNEGEATATFNTDGRMNFASESNDYFVLGNTIYSLKNGEIDERSIMITNDNFETLYGSEDTLHEHPCTRQS